MFLLHCWFWRALLTWPLCLQVQRILSSNEVEVDDGDYHQRTALHLAASNGHIAMVRTLVLGHGANMNVVDRCAGHEPRDARLVADITV